MTLLQQEFSIPRLCATHAGNSQFVAFVGNVRIVIITICVRLVITAINTTSGIDSTESAQVMLLGD